MGRRQPLVRVGIVKEAPAHARDPVLTIDRLIWLDRSGRQCGRHGERFDGRSRLEAVDDGAVAPVRRGMFGRLVRIERRVVRQRKDLAARGIHHDDAAPPRLERAHAQCELTLRDVLNCLVDGEHDALPLDRPVVFHIVREDDVTAPITDGLDPPIGAPESLLVRELNAFDAPSVDIGEPYEVSREVSVGIEASRLRRQLDAGNVELPNASRLVRGDATLNPDEKTIGRQPIRQPLRVDVENLGDAPRNGSRVLLHRLETARVGVDAVDVCADRKLRSVPIVDRAASGGDSEVAEMLIFRHLTQTIARCDLNVKSANHHEHRDAHHTEAKQGDSRPKPSLSPVLHRTLPAAARLGVSFIVTIRVGFGTSMPSVPRAMVSMRPLCRSVAASIESMPRF